MLMQNWVAPRAICTPAQPLIALLVIVTNSAQAFKWVAVVDQVKARGMLYVYITD